MLVQGDCLWSCSGTHVCGEDGFVLTVQHKTVVEFPDLEKYCHAYECVANERVRRNASIGYSNVGVWVVPNTEYMLPSIRKNTLLVPHPTIPDVYTPKASQCGCSNVYAATNVDHVSFDIPWIPKRKEKINTREEIRINKLFATSNIQEVVYDEETARYVQKTTEIRYPIMEMVNIYDEAGNVIQQQEMQRVERVVEMISEPVMDDNNKPVMEDVLDDNGQVVLVPTIPERYFDGTNELSYEEYKTNSNAIKALLIPCSLISTSPVVVTQIYTMP